MDLVLASEEEVGEETLCDGRVMYVKGYWQGDDIVVEDVYIGPGRVGNTNRLERYVVGLLDRDEKILESISFSKPAICGNVIIDSDKPARIWFSRSICFNERTQKTVVKKEGKIIWTKNRSANQPLLTLEFPADGDVVKDAVNIKVNGYDKDGDELIYILDYRNGEGESIISKDITKTQDRSVNINELNNFRRDYDRDKAIFSIICSDGFNAVEATAKVVICNSLRIRSASPTNSTDFPLRQPIKVEFNKTRIEENSINEESFLLLEDGLYPIEGDIELDCRDYSDYYDNCSLLFKPKNSP